MINGIISNDLDGTEFARMKRQVALVTFGGDTMFRKSETGFTLIELLIVVAIIAILAAGAIPNLLRARMSANEAAAEAACRAIAAAQIDYNNNTSPHTYAESLSQLSTGFMAGGIAFIDPDLGGGIRNGYNFQLTGGSPILIPGEVYVSFHAWSAAAWPVVYGSTGTRSFYIDETGVIRGSDLGGIPGTMNLPSID